MSKIQTAVRLDQELINALKEKAKADQRSLNNYIEMVLQRDIGKIPNATTLAAMEDARDESKLEQVDDINAFFDKL